MKNISLITILLLFASCHESLEDKAERETKDFTKRNCPVTIAPGVTNDSITFDKASHTIHYYYSLSGKADTTAIDKNKAKAELLKGVKDATNIKKYKENNFNFSYTYYSTKHKGQVLLKCTFTSKDYNNK